MRVRLGTGASAGSQPEVSILNGGVLRGLPSVHTASLPGMEEINRCILQRFLSLRDDPRVRRSHWFDGRFENLYLDRGLIPEVEPVLVSALDHAARLLGEPGLRVGFWFNDAGPGHGTGLHRHDDDDERLSAVYYVAAPPECGRLLLHAGPAQICVRPVPGLFVFFPPDLPHEVEVNRSGESRLSLAMNFGPAA